jgi:hypothetical protein
MADLTLYRSKEIQHIVQVTHAAQREIGRVHSEGAKLAIETLTVTTQRIQAAARNGASEERVAALIAEQKEYLWEMQRIARHGAGELHRLVSNLPALTDSSR